MINSIDVVAKIAGKYLYIDSLDERFTLEEIRTLAEVEGFRIYSGTVRPEELLPQLLENLSSEDSRIIYFPTDSGLFTVTPKIDADGRLMMIKKIKRNPTEAFGSHERFLFVLTPPPLLPYCGY